MHIQSVNKISGVKTSERQQKKTEINTTKYTREGF